MQNVDFSIIIPHKNVPSLLHRCLDSIHYRSDLQIIVVDDDSSPEIVDFNSFPGKGRCDVEIIYTKEGKGAGYARNVGLSKAVGKWVLFADSDDFFNYCFNEILDEYSNSPYDVVYLNSSSVDTESYVNANRAVHINNAHCLADTDSNKEFFFRYLYGEPWGKLIKKSVIDKYGIRCEETIIHNDTQLSYLVGYYAHSIKYDVRAMYCVTDRKSSVSKQYSDVCYLTRLSVFCKKYSFLSEHGVTAFEEGFILSPFFHFKETKDAGRLATCYKIAEQYGISKSEIDNRMKRVTRNESRTLRRERIKRIIHIIP